MNNIIRAHDIHLLLRGRHSEDVWLAECKNGPTHAARDLCKMDFWAMNKSWTKACVFGYEIKVSRADFLQDDKWRKYLGLCNEFYFVCPPGLIAPDELPAEAGLIYCSKNAARLYTKKKAPRRRVDFPESLWRYILMCRVTAVDGRNIGGNGTIHQPGVLEGVARD